MEAHIENVAGVVVVHINGEIDASTAGELQNTFSELATPNCQILLNMGGITFLSSTGLRAILLLHRQIEGQSGELVLAQLNDELENIMEATGFLAHMNVVDTVQKGLEYFTG